MLIICSKCAISYRVETSALGAAGRPVRCVRCRNVKFARDPAGLSAIAQAYRIEVEALGASISVSQLADWPHEAPVTPRLPRLMNRLPSTRSWSGQVPSDTVRETAKVRIILRPLAAELSNPLRPQKPISTADAAALAPMEQGATIPIDAGLCERSKLSQPTVS
jgi:predicted Zn finger-like uncharacterized protein